jgi:hypothetical protein
MTKAKEELGISADDPKIYVEELKREITNLTIFSIWLCGEGKKYLSLVTRGFATVI